MFRIRIRELRENAGYKSQKAFADAFGVAQTTVASWEGGKREPGYDTTIRLADFFNVSVDYLLGHEIKNAPQEAGREIKPNLTEQELTLIQAYRRADIRAKTIVDAALEPFRPFSSASKAM